MNSDDEELLTICGAVAASLAAIHATQTKRIRKERVNPYLLKRNTKGRYVRDVSNRYFMRLTLPT